MRILTVHHDRAVLSALRGVLEKMSHRVTWVESEKMALNRCRQETFDAALVNWHYEDARSLATLEEIQRIQPRCSIVLLTSLHFAVTAIDAMRRGPYDCLAEPYSLKQIRWVIGRIERLQRLERGVVALETQVNVETFEGGWQTNIPAVQKIHDVAFEAAASDTSILLLGELGTGKKRLARAIHEKSLRRQNAMITINCALRPRESLESELFGHIQGALPGADANTTGRIAAADGGTLFLDAIAEMPVGTQRKLFRFLQDGCYQRLGESKLYRADVRIVSAGDKFLASSSSSGKFDEALYQKISAVSLTLPPLRERLGDIERIACEHLKHAAERVVKRIKGFSPDALDALSRYSWPGNCRELQNVIERAAMLARGIVIELTDLPEIIQCNDEIRVGGRATLEQLENEHLRRIIAAASSFEEAATILGINPATLFRKRRKLRAVSSSGTGGID